jgi:hypothetical protein
VELNKTRSDALVRASKIRTGTRTGKKTGSQLKQSVGEVSFRGTFRSLPKANSADQSGPAAHQKISGELAVMPKDERIEEIKNRAALPKAAPSFALVDAGVELGQVEFAYCGPQKFRPPLRVSNSESGHEKVSLLLEVSEVVIG